MATPSWLNDKKVESGLGKNVQLYNLKTDPSEKNNLADNYPKRVKKMQVLLHRINQGYTREL